MVHHASPGRRPPLRARDRQAPASGGGAAGEATAAYAAAVHRGRRRDAPRSPDRRRRTARRPAADGRRHPVRRLRRARPRRWPRLRAYPAGALRRRPGSSATRCAAAARSTYGSRAGSPPANRGGGRATRRAQGAARSPRAQPRPGALAAPPLPHPSSPSGSFSRQPAGDALGPRAAARARATAARRELTLASSPPSPPHSRGRRTGLGPRAPGRVRTEPRGGFRAGCAARTAVRTGRRPRSGNLWPPQPAAGYGPHSSRRWPRADAPSLSHVVRSGRCDRWLSLRRALPASRSSSSPPPWPPADLSSSRAPSSARRRGHPCEGSPLVFLSSSGLVRLPRTPLAPYGWDDGLGGRVRPVRRAGARARPGGAGRPRPVRRRHRRRAPSAPTPRSSSPHDPMRVVCTGDWAAVDPEAATRATSGRCCRAVPPSSAPPPPSGPRGRSSPPTSTTPSSPCRSPPNSTSAGSSGSSRWPGSPARSPWSSSPRPTWCPTR